jgi:hypothetical protein
LSTADISDEVLGFDVPGHQGHDPYAYMKDVLQWLPTHKMSAIGELLPHRWQPRQAVVIA